MKDEKRIRRDGDGGKEEKQLKSDWVRRKEH